VNKEEFDKLFDQAFEESVQNHNFTPDAGPSWEKLQSQLAKKKRRKSQLRALPYIAASFILGAFLFGTPTASNAFQPLFQAVVTIKDDVVRIVFGEKNTNNVVPKTPPPPGDDNVFIQETVPSDGSSAVFESKRVNYKTWEEAAPFLDFHVPEIHYIAEGFQLMDVNLIYDQVDSPSPRVAVITYINDEGFVYSITFQRILPGTFYKIGGGAGIDVETLEIGNIKNYITTTKDGTVAQEFVIDDIRVSIIGPLSHEEARLISEEIINGMT